MKYSRVILGGTFDRLHLGHQALLDKAFAIGVEVWIGLTTPEFLARLPDGSKKLPSVMQSYVEREKGLTDYFTREQTGKRARIMPISDKFASSVTEPDIDTIVVSPETEPVAKEINMIRAQKNFTPLSIIRVPWVNAQDGERISSQRIRRGEIDRVGGLFTLPDTWGTRFLPEDLRFTLKKPLGELIKDTDHNHEVAVKELVVRFFEAGRCTPFAPEMKPNLIAVGDAVTDALIREGIIPDISIVDLKINRKQVYKNVSELGFRNKYILKNANNPAGTITFNSYNQLKYLIQNETGQSILQIDGEEDLMTLCAIFLAPLESLIVYGQPGEGIVVVTATEPAKAIARDYLGQFTEVKK